MTHRSTHAARFALHALALATAALCSTQALGLGLGRLNVQSALGETLKAEIEVTSMTAEEAASLQLRVASADAYRAAGVEYNSVLPSAQVQVQRLPDGRTVLRLSSSRAVLEPFVDVIIEAAWSSGRLVREYTMLFDPPSTRTAQAAAAAAAPVVTAPAMPSTPLATAPAPSPAPLPAPSPAARPAPRLAPPEPPRPPVVSSAPPLATPGNAGNAGNAGGDEYRVRPGDSLSRIAGRAQRPGVSLDQMLVALFRGNPQAFSGDNMNRLKAGAVLSMPSAEQAAKLPAQDARDTIVAQSNDFAAYRQRLAGGVAAAPKTADDTPARQAKGQVQAQVDDRKQAAAPTPDRLTLAQGGAKASAAAAQASKATEKKDSTARLAELARNVDELKRLQANGTPAPATPTPAPVSAPAPVVAAAPPPAAAPAPAPVAAPTPAAPAAATTPAIAPTVVATAPPALSPTPAPTPAATPPAAQPKPAAVKPANPATPPRDEPGVLGSLLDNSLLLPAGGVLVALLVGLGLYRLRGRMRRPAGETSFLESRLQPDSFFGASGGQRIDTRDAAASGTGSGNSSSMSYSLSQLDAIGDVDPVAEADVYLAYGRDLQAEEILKEAMRATPERMAIRSKLLEVYAKRRDTKAFELLASQLFNLTRGEGDDWAKAQALGQSIDPDNVLYQPGGQPGEVRGVGGQVVGDALAASTVPYTAPVNPPTFQPAPDATLEAGNSGALDLDLELDMPAAGSTAAPAVGPHEATMPITTHAQRTDDHTLDLSHDDPKTVPGQRPSPAAAAAADDMLDFDLGTLGAESPTVAIPKPAPDPALDFGDFSIGGERLSAPAPLDGGDPLARKVELAEEFRQIGDLEGARDLLEEVLAKGDGPLKAKAQGMLDKLDR